MFVIKYRKIFFIFSVLLIAISIFAMVKFGFNFGIDFKGGSIAEFSYPSGRPALDELKPVLEKTDIGGFTLQPTGDKNYVLRARELSQDEKNKVTDAMSLGGKFEVKEERFNSVGPMIGNELKNKAYVAIGIVILGIVLFITFAFRKVSKPVSSWKYGLATIIALAHDVIIPAGVFIIFIHYFTGEIDLLFVSAILAILGYSVHDTIVVFDRIRENLRLRYESGSKEDFEETVGKSVSQTFGRSINTSLTIFVVLLVLYLIGGETTRNFAFVLLVGVVAGTYSSIFIASPLLVLFERRQASLQGKK